VSLFAQGNGKTLRTERAMAVFPVNWITVGMNGTLPPTQTFEHMLLPSIQTSLNVEFQWNWVHIMCAGQSDSTNGKNVVRCAAVLMCSFALRTHLVD
jgi:hypothetical protein